MAKIWWIRKSRRNFNPVASRRNFIFTEVSVRLMSRLAKSPLFDIFDGRNSQNTTSGRWTVFDPDVWLRQQLWAQLWRGPGAVSAYWSIAVQLVCVGLSAGGDTG